MYGRQVGQVMGEMDDSEEFEISSGVPPGCVLKARVCCYLLDVLIDSLANVGVQLNASKTVIMTTEAQPPAFLTTKRGVHIKPLEPAIVHRWLGCMLPKGLKIQLLTLTTTSRQPRQINTFCVTSSFGV